ncbi:polysaccharide deacetylase family protein [Variovorax sp. J22R133]|uniref:polysaccharide deacetylase family protein n=1 Tax=Variovorax brevis TaxID=3053503 RepID=UPI002577F59B|nr:polysaccharide deacetylase family protein [Variovorax sp. J22R133]MDM0117356.1 polysaccharide deacetylase family protein [Variovorax sp. J22R133]
MARQHGGPDLKPVNAKGVQMARAMTLTFDNGPTVEVTPHVLDVLDRYEIRSTFFVLGQNLEDPQARGLARHAAGQGHWIGNHTYTHTVPLGETTDPRVAQDEIARTQTLMADVAHPDKFFRPFGNGGLVGPHLLSPAAFEYLQANAFTCVLWNCVPRDWDDPEGWVDTALRQSRERDWTLTVLHDYQTGAMRNLERFIQAALDEGISLRQEFPPDCLPMVRGVRVRPMGDMISTVASAA